jgi:glycosyltransferase involved in cell wall biosynthesis
MSRRLRMLHVITRLDHGGSAENTLLTVAGLDPECYDITLAVGPTVGDPSPTEIEARRRGVRFVDMPHLVRAPQPTSDVRALRCLQRLLREEVWDLVHTHTSKAGILGRWAAHRAGVPGIVHTPHGHVFYGYYGSVVTGAFIRLERRAANWCHRLVALTAADREDHLRFGVGAPSQWDVIHSGVDFAPLSATATDRAAMRMELGIGRQDLVIGTLGRLAAVKGQQDLVRAFSVLLSVVPEARLLLVGDGEQEVALRSLASDLGVISRCVFGGWRQDVGDVLRAVDIFALPSHNEGMGKALVEAMYLGCPVVATNVGGIPELITDGVEGLLVAPRDPASLAEALQRLVADVALRQRLGSRAAVRAHAYSSQLMVEKLSTLYQELALSGYENRRAATVAG